MFCELAPSLSLPPYLPQLRKIKIFEEEPSHRRTRSAIKVRSDTWKRAMMGGVKRLTDGRRDRGIQKLEDERDGL